MLKNLTKLAHEDHAVGVRYKSTAAQDDTGNVAVGQLRVLIVEDDPKIASPLMLLLTKRGCLLKIAATLAEARAILSVNEVDWVLLDLMLPDGDGKDLLREIRSKSFSQNVAVISGVEESRLTALAILKPTALLRKPVSIAELFHVLNV